MDGEPSAGSLRDRQALVAGVNLLRWHALGWRLPWTLLALGISVFAGLIPTLATESFVAGRVAIMRWMVRFVLVERVMGRLAR